MKQKLFLFIMAVFALITLAACGSKNSDEKADAGGSEKNKEVEEVVVKHQLDETKVKKNPEKVVVFDFGILDTLDTFGVEITGVPKQGIPTYLSKYEADKYANVGGLKEPDFEAINELQPDLIIISTRQQELYEDFAEIAPTIFMGIDYTKYMESFKENVNTLAEIFDKEDIAKEELANVDEAVAALKEKAEKIDKKALIILANDGKVSAYGQNSRFGIIHDVFGIKPVDKNIEASTHGQSISFEYIAEKNPDYLFVIDRGAVVTGGNSSAKQIVENSLVNKTNAVKDGNVVYLDANYWYLSGGGLISVPAMIDSIAELFNK